MIEQKIENINQQIITEIKNRIINTVNPDKIILFGSYAYGNPTSESDLDILVVMHSNVPRYKRSIPIYNCLAGIMVPKDIVVYSNEEIEEWKDVPQAFITTIMQNGKMIHEKK